MPTVSDIARKAGVSTATVSRVINHNKAVHQDTQQCVVQAMHELGYRPNMLARSLRKRQTHTIGLVVSDIENPFFTEVARAVETAAYERGYNVILCNTDESLEKETMYLDVLFAKQVDGIILAPAPGDHGFLKDHLNRNARVAFVNRLVPSVPCPSVVGDDEHGMFELTQRLLAGGHTSVGAVLGLRGVWTTESRLAGFRRALADHGKSLNETWLFEGKARRDGGYQAARALAAMPNPPSAVVAFNSLMLDGILEGLYEHAPRLVRQIEVTGFGFTPFARCCHSSEQYVIQPTYEMGRTAVTLLIDALEGRAPWRPDVHVLKNRLLDVAPASADQIAVIGDRPIAPDALKQSRR